MTDVPAIPTMLFLKLCNVCSCSLEFPDIRLRAAPNSKELLGHCIRLIWLWLPFPRTIRLLKAKFVQASDIYHLMVKLHISGEGIPDWYHLTEFIVRRTICKPCCEKPTRVQLRQAHIQPRDTLFPLKKAMTEHGLTSRALMIQENVLGTDYWFSNRAHALDLVQFIEGVVPVKKQSDDDGVSATFFSLRILSISRDDLIPGYMVGLGNNFVICTGVAAHGISLVCPFTLRTAFLTAEDYWRAPCVVVKYGSKLLAEYLVLDIVTITTTDPLVADDDDSYCLADAHIVRVLDLEKTKLLVRTHLGRLLKPGDHVLGYGGFDILVKKGCLKKSVVEPSSQEPRSVGKVLDGIRNDEFEELLREFDRLGLSNSSPHQISEESQMLPAPSDAVPFTLKRKWLGEEAAADNTTMERLPSIQPTSPQQIHGQQNGIGDIQQHQQRILLKMQQQQQIILLNMQKITNQQAMSLHQQQQQHSSGSQNNMSALQQQQQLLGWLPSTSNLQLHQRPMLLLRQQIQQLQQLTQRLSLSLLQSQGQQSQLQPSQQLQLPGLLPSTSNLQPHKQAMLLKQLTQRLSLSLLQSQGQQSQLQPSQQPHKRAMLLLQKQRQQLTQRLSLSLLQSQGQQSQLQPSQQPLMSQFQNPPTRMQQQLLMQQPSNSLQREMHQRLQGPDSLLQDHNAIEQQPLIQTQRALQEVSSSTSADSTTQTGPAGAVDWQEELYRKMLSLKELYYGDLIEFHDKMKMKLQQLEAQELSWQHSYLYEKMMEPMLLRMQISSKEDIPIDMKEKFHLYEKQVVRVVTYHRSQKVPPQSRGQQFQHPNHPVPQQQPSHGSQMMQLSDDEAQQDPAGTSSASF